MPPASLRQWVPIHFFCSALLVYCHPVPACLPLPSACLHTPAALAWRAAVPAAMPVPPAKEEEGRRFLPCQCTVWKISACLPAWRRRREGGRKEEGRKGYSVSHSHATLSGGQYLPPLSLLPVQRRRTVHLPAPTIHHTARIARGAARRAAAPRGVNIVIDKHRHCTARILGTRVCAARRAAHRAAYARSSRRWRCCCARVSRAACGYHTPLLPAARTTTRVTTAPPHTPHARLPLFSACFAFTRTAATFCLPTRARARTATTLPTTRTHYYCLAGCSMPHTATTGSVQLNGLLPYAPFARLFCWFGSQKLTAFANVVGSAS